MNVKKTTFNALFVASLAAGAVFSSNAMELSSPIVRKNRSHSAPETPTKTFTRQDGSWTPQAINIYNKAEHDQENRQPGDVKHTNKFLGREIKKSQSRLDATETNVPKFDLKKAENIFAFEVSHAPFEINHRIIEDEKNRQENAANKTAAAAKRNERKLQEQLKHNEETARVLARKAALFAECDEFSLIEKKQRRTNRNKTNPTIPTAVDLPQIYVEAPMITFDDQSLSTLTIPKRRPHVSIKEDNPTAPITPRERLPKIIGVPKKSDNVDVSSSSTTSSQEDNEICLRSDFNFTPVTQDRIGKANKAKQPNLTHPTDMLKKHVERKNLQPVPFDKK